MRAKITVVVADFFGPEVVRKAKLGPLWIVRSEENQKAVDNLRRSKSRSLGRVTLFNPHGGTVEATALAALEIINFNDQGWADCEVIGARPSATLARALNALGAGTLEPTRGGFVFSRTSRREGGLFERCPDVLGQTEAPRNLGAVSAANRLICATSPS